MATVPFIGRAAPPEAAATHALYERYAAQILRYCLHQLGSREEAEDAVQSTFLNAFRGLKRGIEPELESAWLFKIAHNVCLSRRRSTWRRGRIESPADFELVEELAPAPSRRADELIGLQDVLEGMPEQQRRAILLREWQGLSYREIGAELELSQAAVETLIFRARRSLAAGLEQPAETARRRRSAPAAALGNLLSAAQGWLFGGGAAAVKVAATVAVVGAGTVVATAPVERHHATPKPHTPVAQVATTPKPAPVLPVPAHPVVVAPAPVRTAPVRTHRAPVRHAAAPKVSHVAVVQPAQRAPVVQQAAPPVETEPPVETAPAQQARPALPAAARAHGRAHEQHGRATAPGQLKQHRQDAPPAAGPSETQTTPAQAEQPPAAEDHGNGNGHGRADAPGQQNTPPGQSKK